MAQRYSGKWEVIGSVGEGGQAHAFRVRRIDDDTDGWVLKRLKNPARIGRFEQEIEVLRHLQCKRIPTVEDYSLEEGYFVYPYIGPTLAQVVRDENLTFDEGFDLVRDVVEAVAVAHDAGVLHRDIKPDNVVVDPARAPGRRAYLIDFGICQWDEGNIFKTTTDEPLGNRNFAPPEFELGSETAPTQQSDVYMLGKLLYWVVTGGQFFPREDLLALSLLRIPEPRGVERNFIRRIVSSAVNEDPHKRISAAELQRVMERDGALMRLGTNAVGAPDQLCGVCRRGRLHRREDLLNLGFNVVGNPPAQVRMLQCDYCGYLQHHSIKGTGSQTDEVWEI